MVTDPNYENETASGGLFVSFNNVSEKSADVRLDIHIRNMSEKKFSGKIEYKLYDKNGKEVKTIEKKYLLPKTKPALQQPT